MTAPSTLGTSLLTFTAASLAVIGLTYAATRMLGRWQVTQSKGRRMRVLEGVPVGKDRSLLLVAVGKEVLVVGSSPQGVQLVHQVTDAAAAAELLTAEVPEPQAPGVPQLLTTMAQLKAATPQIRARVSQFMASAPQRLAGVPQLVATVRRRLSGSPATAPAADLTPTETAIRGHLARMNALTDRAGGAPHE